MARPEEEGAVKAEEVAQSLEGEAAGPSPAEAVVEARTSRHDLDAGEVVKSTRGD